MPLLRQGGTAGVADSDLPDSGIYICSAGSTGTAPITGKNNVLVYLFVFSLSLIKFRSILHNIQRFQYVEEAGDAFDGDTPHCFGCRAVADFRDRTTAVDVIENSVCMHD